MRLNGSESAKKQGKAISDNLTRATAGLNSLLDNLTGQLSKEEKQDFASYKNTPEGRKQSAVFDKIREGVSEVMDNIPKQ